MVFLFEGNSYDRKKSNKMHGKSKSCDWTGANVMAGKILEQNFSAAAPIPSLVPVFRDDRLHGKAAQSLLFSCL
jgi:hypothetical protein